MSDPTRERAVLLEQVGGYLAWEEELGGQALPRSSWVPEAVTAEPATARAGVQPAQLGASAPGAAARPAVRRDAGPEPLPGARGPGGARDTEQRRPDAEPRVSTLTALAEASPVPQQGDLHQRLALLQDQVQGCTRCELHKARTQTVFARGNPESRLVFVGEGPGQEEDRTGAPFVGPAGQLLDRMVAAMGLGRDDVYICNIVKCRPPGNRTPLPSEAGACAPFLLGQLDAIQPRVIVALGRCAAENMGLVAGGGWRGRWGRFRGIDVMPTYHPAFLLRSPEFKRPVWEDLQKVMAKLQAPG